MLLLFMASRAVFRFFHVKRFLPIMALAAEVALGDLGHIHFVRSVSHLEYLIVASHAFQAFSLDVEFVTEDDGTCILRRKGYIPPAHLFRKNGAWHSQTEKDD
jgi:hypothetical protein